MAPETDSTPSKEDISKIENPTDKKIYAWTGWNVNDVLSLRPQWSEEKAERFLAHNESIIQQAMAEAGWGAIETLLCMPFGG